MILNKPEFEFIEHNCINPVIKDMPLFSKDVVHMQRVRESGMGWTLCRRSCSVWRTNDCDRVTCKKCLELMKPKEAGHENIS